MDDMNDIKHISGLTLAIHFVSPVHVLCHSFHEHSGEFCLVLVIHVLWFQV